MVPELREIERPCARKGDKRKAVPSIVIQSSRAVSVKIEVDVVGLRSLTVLMDSVDVTQHWSERERERQRDRQTDRQTERQTDRDTDRQTDRHRQRQTERARAL